MSVGYVQMEFPFVDDLHKTTAKSTGFLGKLKGISNFLIGEWAKPVGIEYHAFSKDISIFEAYDRYKKHSLQSEKAIKAAGFAKKSVEEAAKATTSSATKEVSKSAFKTFFKTAGKFLGKYAGPIMCFIGPVIGAINELKNGGGIVGAIKEISKGCIGLVGFSAGTLVATALFGLSTGFWAGVGIFLLGALGSMAFEFLAKAVLGKSTAEKIAEKKENENDSDCNSLNLYKHNKQMLAGNSFGGGLNSGNISAEMQQAEARFQAAKRMFESRNLGTFGVA